jgi:hypothetical protein
VRGLLIAVLLAGCGTKVLELAGPDAGPPPFAAPFCVKDPVVCQRCYDRWGAPTTVGCPEAGSPSQCFVKQDPVYERCLYCGADQRGCLKCPPATVGNCVECGWTDNAATCTICYDGSAQPTKDSCNLVRPELGKS